MIYTDQTKKAMKICFEAHKNQVDKVGLPYVYHPLHVAEAMNDENTTVVALLHDVIEDTNITIDDIISYGFDEEIVEALKCLTHDKNVDYYDYIKIISFNKIATIVKLADLEHNMDLNRLNNITEKDLDRVKKYKNCYQYLYENLKLLDNGKNK